MQMTVILLRRDRGKCAGCEGDGRQSAMITGIGSCLRSRYVAPAEKPRHQWPRFPLGIDQRPLGLAVSL